MTSRAMIVVGAGSSIRFGMDKLSADISGRPLIAHTLDALTPHVDICIVVTGPELAEMLAETHPGVRVTPGGATRTLSELAGLAALGGDCEVIGIHDAARPVIRGFLVNRLFEIASRVGGAVPVLDPDRVIVDRATLGPITRLKRAQTPQVFRGPEMMTAYVKAAQAGFDGHDTASVMQRHSDVTIVAVQGDPDNVKVTFPGDLERVRATITARSRT